MACIPDCMELAFYGIVAIYLGKIPINSMYVIIFR